MNDAQTKACRYLTVAECARFGPPGHKDEVTPYAVYGGNVHSVLIYTGHVSGWREPRTIPHGHRTYARLVQAIDTGEVP